MRRFKSLTTAQVVRLWFSQKNKLMLLYLLILLKTCQRRQEYCTRLPRAVTIILWLDFNTKLIISLKKMLRTLKWIWAVKQFEINGYGRKLTNPPCWISTAFLQPLPLNVMTCMLVVEISSNSREGVFELKGWPSYQEVMLFCRCQGDALELIRVATPVLYLTNKLSQRISFATSSPKTLPKKG